MATSVRLAFPGDIGAAIDFVHSASYDDTAMHLSKAPHLVRKDMSVSVSFHFSTQSPLGAHIQRSLP